MMLEIPHVIYLTWDVGNAPDLRSPKRLFCDYPVPVVGPDCMSSTLKGLQESTRNVRSSCYQSMLGMLVLRNVLRTLSMCVFCCGVVVPLLCDMSSQYSHRSTYKPAHQLATIEQNFIAA
jgi:hypothetical protein